VPSLPVGRGISAAGQCWCWIQTYINAS